LLSCPDREYLNVFKFNRLFATHCTGISKASVDAGVEQLEEIGYIETYNGYVKLLKGDAVMLGGRYNKINSDRELERMPVDVREHFELDSEDIIVVEKTKKTPKKTGPKPETVKEIIARQPEELRGPLQDFVEDRIERKKAPTTRAVKGWIDRLQTMYPNDYKKQSLSLQQSIDRGWLGLFEVHEDKQKTNSGGFL
tara:strand:+ start:1557 stop:2144 length:588 start_codon:yes stop_codon:yes gene_type:complete